MTDHGIRLREALAGRYRVERELGSGAAATVWLGHDLKHDRAVAIKVLRSDLTATLVGERFLREIAIAARLQHPHILPLLDSGEAAGSFYFVMPFAEGETLRTRLERSGPLSVAETLRILADVADALVYAHRRGVIHRDIKPDNIMVSGRHAVVMDFGVAKALGDAAEHNPALTAGVALGTPAYMAPEQATADPRADHRVDLYAFGILGYELLTGSPPFRGMTPREVLAAHLSRPVEPIADRRPDVPAPLAELVMRCLAKSPADRWPSAESIVERLDPLVTPSRGSTPAATVPIRRWERIFPWLASAVGVAGVAAAIWSAARRADASPPAPFRAEQVTFEGTPIEAAISPDGQFLAYLTGGARQRLMVRDLTGSTAVVVAEGEMLRDVSWAANGAELSFRQWEAGSWTVRTAPRLGGAGRTVLAGVGIRSPDGEKVVLIRPSTTALPVVSVARGDTAVLTRTDGHQWVAGIAWGPRSDRLAIAISAPETGRTGLAVMTLDGKETVVVRDSVGIVAPAWDPDGTALYYARSSSGLDADVMRVRLRGDGTPAGRPELIAAGLAVVLDSRRSPTFATLSVSRTGKLGYVRTQLSSNLGRVTVGRDTTGLPIAPVTMGTARYLMPKLSPDGTRLAVFKVVARGATLGVTGAAGGELTEIATMSEPGDIAWSPDGKAIAFTGTGKDGGLVASVHQIGSGRLRQFGAGRVGVYLDWLGDRLVLQAAGSRELVILDPATDSVRPFRPDDGSSLYFSPRVSPDGNRVAYLVIPGSGQAGIAIAPLNGAGEPGLYHPVRSRPLRWSADGRTLYAAELGPGGDYNRVVAITGPDRATIVARFPDQAVVEDISGDGRTIIVNELMKQSDVWVGTVPAGARR